MWCIFSIFNLCFTVFISALPFTELCFERMLLFYKLGLKFGFCLNLGKSHYTEYLCEELGFHFQPLGLTGNSVLILTKDGSLVIL